MATRSPLSAPERTILVHGALGALLALALHAALLNRVWPWHNPFATLFAIQWVWLVPLAGAMLAGMRSGRRWLLALLAYALALPALHAYGLMPLLGSQPVRYSDDGPRALARRDHRRQRFHAASPDPGAGPIPAGLGLPRGVPRGLAQHRQAGAGRRPGPGGLAVVLPRAPCSA
ncbi:hypothetical protein WJ977_18095 [Achromobacter xylosoxidans]